MKVKAESIRDVSTELGDAPEEEYTFLLVPVVVYSMVSQRARAEGCSTGEVFQKAILKYLHAAEEGDFIGSAERQPLNRPEPAIVVNVKRR